MLMRLAILHALLKIMTEQPLYWRMESIRLVKMKVMRGALSMLMKLAILHALMKIMIDQPIYRRMESIKPIIQAMVEILSE